MAFEGWLQKESRWIKKWHWRYVVISDEGILRSYTCEPCKALGAAAAPEAGSSFAQAMQAPEVPECQVTEELSLRGGQCWPATGGLFSALPYRFSVFACGRTTSFAARSSQERQQWLEALAAASCSCVGRASEVRGSSFSHPERGQQRPASFALFGSAPQRALPPARLRPPSPLSSASSAEAPSLKSERRRPLVSRAIPDVCLESHEQLASCVLLGADGGHASSKPSASSDASAGQPPATRHPRAPDGGAGHQQPPINGSAGPEQPTMASGASSDATSEQQRPVDQKPQHVGPSPTGRSSVGKGKPPAPPPGKGKGFGKGPSKGSKGGKGKGSPTPPGRGGGKDTRATSLPIGRRLTVRVKHIDAEAFRGLLNPSAAGLLADVEGPSGDGPGGTGASSSSAAALRPAFDPTAVDFAELHEAFAQQQRAEPKKKPQKAGGLELLPADMAQNVAIVLSKLSVSTERLADALSKLDPAVGMISADESARLLDVWPSAEVLKGLAEYAKEADAAAVERLRDIEKQVLPLAALPRMGPRLRLMVVARTLPERFDDALKQLARLQVACGELRQSTVLSDLLAIVLVVFNYVNFGTEAKSADRLQGVDVLSLLRLQETKAYRGSFAGFNMLHYVLKQLHRQRPQLTPADWEAELPTLNYASGVSLERLRQELAQLRGDLAFVRGELSDHRPAYEDPVPVQEDGSMEAAEPHDSEASCVSSTTAAPDPGKHGTSGGVSSGDGAVAETAAAEVADSPALGSPEPSEKSGTTDYDIIDREEVNIELDGRGFTPRPPLNRRRTVLQALIGQGVDFASTAGAVMRGDEIIGRPEAPFAEIPGFELAVADGHPSPPGWLWILRPSKLWQRCWCEVRGPLLLVYRVKAQRCLGVTYTVIAGAEVAAFSSASASEASRALADSAPYGFEVRSGAGAQILRLCSSMRADADRWSRLLVDQSRLVGAGYLSIHQEGLAMHAPGKRPHFCRLVVDRLLAYARPRDCLEGTSPEFCWIPNRATVRPLSVSEFGASNPARRSRGIPTFGFELEDFCSGRRWQFTCDTLADERAWLQALMAPGVESPRARDRPKEEAGVPFVGARDLDSASCENPVVVPAACTGASDTVPLDNSVTLSTAGTGASDSDLVENQVPVSSAGTGASDSDLFEKQVEVSNAGTGASDSATVDTTAAIATPTASTCPTPSVASIALPEAAAFTAVTDSSRGASFDHPVVASAPRPGAPVSQSALPQPSNAASNTGPGLDPSCFSELGDEPERSTASTGCIARLELLQLELADKIEQLSCAVAAAEEDCRAILLFFGLEAPPPGPRLGAVVGELLESTVAFMRQLKMAWDELDRHKEFSTRKKADEVDAVLQGAMDTCSRSSSRRTAPSAA